MSQRKLTRRQQWRIEKIQEERSARAAKRDQLADEQLNDTELGPEQQGLVITHFGTQVVIESIQGDNAGQQQRCHFRSNLGSLVTGDKVVWRAGNPTGVVVAVMPRESALQRPDPHGEMKTVAANIDRIMIVVAPYPEPHANLIDRYLVAANAIDIEPVLVINKIDRIDDATREKIDYLQKYLSQTGLHSAVGFHQIRPRPGFVARLFKRLHQRVCRPIGCGQVVVNQCVVTRLQFTRGGFI